MRKSGFTLAEILITLGIIGIVAALTAPSLVNRAGGAKVGPTLAKAVAVIENANQQMMLDEGINNVVKDFNNFQEYCEAVSKYINKGVCISRNGQIDVYDHSGKQDYTHILNLPGGACVYGNSRMFWDWATLDIDINGASAGPNTYGKDVFMFYFNEDNGFSLIPEGSDEACVYNNESNISNCSRSWRRNSGAYSCNESKVSITGYGCAGSIFDNDLKVIYE